MSKTLKFNRLHKNGWLSYRLPGVAGAVFIDRRMLSPETIENPPTTLDLDFPGMLEPGADASEKAAEKEAKRLEREQKKAERAAAAAEKAQARLAKLEEAKKKAEEAIARARANASQGDAPAEEAAAE